MEQERHKDRIRQHDRNVVEVSVPDRAPMDHDRNAELLQQAVRDDIEIRHIRASGNDPGVIPPRISPVERAKDDSDRRRVDQVFEEHQSGPMESPGMDTLRCGRRGRLMIQGRGPLRDGAGAQTTLAAYCCNEAESTPLERRRLLKESGTRQDSWMAVPGQRQPGQIDPPATGA